MIGLGVDMGRRHETLPPYWPEGAAYAADFASGRYQRDGEEIAPGHAFSFSRPGPAWARDKAGNISAFETGMLRRNDRGAVLEGARTRLSRGPLELGGSQWISEGSASFAALPAEGLFITPCRLFSGGFAYSRRSTALMDLVQDVPVSIRVRYRRGTSGNFGLYMRNEAGQQSVLSGPVGTMSVSGTGSGGWSRIELRTLGDTLYELTCAFTPNASQPYRLGISPRSDIAGDYVDVLAAQLTLEPMAGEWMLADPGNISVQPADSLVLHLPATPGGLALRLADGRSRSFAGLAGDWSVPLEIEPPLALLSAVQGV